MTLSVRALLQQNPDLACSGGARGADAAWGAAAHAAGHNVLHYGFEGHRCVAEQGYHVILNTTQLARANPALAQANQSLGRAWPTRSPDVNNLLRRNWYQIRRTRSLYAVAPIDTTRQLIDGGTGWAVQMYLDRDTRDPLYRRAWVWDTRTECWHALVGGRWTPCDQPPPPRGPYTAIGTRDLPPAGEAAIAAIYG